MRKGVESRATANKCSCTVASLFLLCFVPAARTMPAALGGVLDKKKIFVGMVGMGNYPGNQAVGGGYDGGVSNNRKDAYSIVTSRLGMTENCFGNHSQDRCIGGGFRNNGDDIFIGITILLDGFGRGVVSDFQGDSTGCRCDVHFNSFTSCKSSAGGTGAGCLCLEQRE